VYCRAYEQEVKKILKKDNKFKLSVKILYKITPSTLEDKTFFTILNKIQLSVQYCTTTKNFLFSTVKLTSF